MPILALASTKGGSGKSTLAACIAAELHHRGRNIALLDADPQQTLTAWVDADPQQTLTSWRDAGGAGRSLRDAVLHTDASETGAAWATRQQALVVVDTAGVATRTLATVLGAADVILIPCRASPLDAQGALATARLAEQYGKPGAAIGAVLTAVTRIALVDHIRKALEDGGVSVMTSTIGLRVAFAEAALLGSAPCWMGGGAARAASEIAALIDELQDVLTP